jgi:hypothetical protein
MLEIRRASLDDLHADPANPRVHNEKNLQTIISSLAEFGQVDPLIVQRGTGRVIGGNGRLAAMRAMGWTECDVVDVDMDNVRAIALNIALNRTAELADWDEPALAELLRGLQSEEDPGAFGATGFTAGELDELIKGLGDGVTGGSDGEAVDDPAGEWRGMPEFEHEDLTSKYRAIVHFANEADMRAFEELVG